MFRRSLSVWVAVAWAALLLVPDAHSQAESKRQVQTANDLPRFTYPIQGKASDLLQADSATFNRFAAKVRPDLETVLRDYDITDKATMRSLLQAKLDLQTLAGDYDAALQTVSSLRALEEKPAAALPTGLFTTGVLQAAIEPKSPTGRTSERE